jgi:poly(3-hydroxybutyrate) depolymerase
MTVGHATAPPAFAPPVLLFFHGDGGSGDVLLPSLYRETDAAGAIVVQLEGPNRVPVLARGSTAWSVRMDEKGPDDVAFSDAAIDALLQGAWSKDIAGDARRVYAAGVSRGGFFAYTLAVDPRTAQRLAGIAVVSGSFYCEADDAVCMARMKSPGFGIVTPAIHLHGDADNVVQPPTHLPKGAPAKDQGLVLGQALPSAWPAGNMLVQRECKERLLYTREMMVGKTKARVFAPDETQAPCELPYELVLVPGAGHSVPGWEAAAWSFLQHRRR